MGNYAHGNQPIQHMIYLYNYAKQPWKAQNKVRDVMKKLGESNAWNYNNDGSLLMFGTQYQATKGVKFNINY